MKIRTNLFVKILPVALTIIVPLILIFLVKPVTAFALADLTASTPTQTAGGAAEAPTSFSSTITNGGNVSAGFFWNLLQVAQGSNGSSIIDSVTPTATMPTVFSNGGYRTATISYTFSTAGSYSVRICADQNANGVGSITESNETNNCSVSWLNITISPPAPTLPTLSAVTPPLNITSTSATLRSQITSGTSLTARGTCLGTTDDPTTCVALGGTPTTGLFSHSRTGLTPNTTYYYRGYATNSAGTGHSPSAIFTTSAAVVPAPDLTAGSVTPTTATAGSSRTFSATISNGGNASTGASFNYFFQRSTQSNGGGTVTAFTSSSMSTLAAGGSGVASVSYTPASAGTFYIRVCADKSSATNLGTITESNEDNNCGGWTSVTVSGSATVPTLASPTAANITRAEARLGANVTSNGGAALTARGTCWGTTNNPTTNCVAEGETSTGVFSHNRVGLSPNTTYYYRGYATNSAGTGYSPSGSFTTPASPVTCTSVWDSPTELVNGVPYGVRWFEEPSRVRISMSGMVPNSTFITRSTVEAGPDYVGSVHYVQFDSSLLSPPMRTDANGSWSVYDTTPIPLDIHVAISGGPDERGYVFDQDGYWKGTYHSTWRDSNNNILASCGGFIIKIALPDLIVDSTDSFYEVTFNRVNVNAMIKNIGYSKAGAEIFGGNYDYDGGSFYNFAQIARGNTNTVVLNSVPFDMLPLEPNQSRQQIFQLTFPGSITRPMVQSERFYYRVCADKSNPLNNGLVAESDEDNNCSEWAQVVGTGGVVATAPTVTSPTATNINSTGATLGANVSSNGGATLTARGTCWGTTNDPTTNCVAEGGTTLGTFSHIRTGLTANTIYYYRGYATNSAGTGYSSSATFTTLAAVVTAPDLTAGGVTPTTATAGSSRTFSATISNGGNASTGASFNYFFQRATGQDGGGTITGFNSSSMSTLTAGGSNTASVSYAPASAGTFSIRVCADKRDISDSWGIIAESNEGNNCGGWTNVTVSSPAQTTASINADSTSIPYNTGTIVRWSSTNATEGCSVSPSGWEGTSGFKSTGNLTSSRTYTISCNPGSVTDSVTVNVQSESRLLNVIKTGQGTIVSDPSGINCGSDCSESYPSGTSVTLTATPATGRIFTGWGGNCSGRGVCNLTMSSAKSVTANFAVNPDYKEF